MVKVFVKDAVAAATMSGQGDKVPIKAGTRVTLTGISNPKGGIRFSAKGSQALEMPEQDFLKATKDPD